MSTPDTRITICRGVPLSNKYDHTLLFSSIGQQSAYFARKASHQFTGYAYARKNWKLRVADAFENAREWSYLFFKNGSAGKTWYYFITNIEYISDSAVELSLELDVLQTYMFDWTLHPCYIERQHARTDEIGANTVDEGLATGDHVTARVDTYHLSDELSVMIATTIDLNEFYYYNEELPAYIRTLDKVVSGFEVFSCPLTGLGPAAITTLFRQLDEEGKTDAIFTMWQYPSKLLDLKTGSFGEQGTPLFRYIVGSKEDRFECGGRGVSLDGYVPKNNKLYQYPYSFMYATNHAGGTAIYKYEFFQNEPAFIVNGNVAPDAVVRFSPWRYKGLEKNLDESFTVGNFPLCSWNSDPYKLWLAQNQSSQTVAYITGGAQIVAGVGAGIASIWTGGLTAAAGGGLIMSGIGTISGQLAQNADMDVQPPQSRGANSGSHLAGISAQRLDVHHKTLDYTHAKIIDDFFTLYGYAKKSVDVPDLDARPCWTYVKTVGSNVTGDFCHDDLQTINGIFDRGITFWNYNGAGDAIGDYSLNNAPTV